MVGQACPGDLTDRRDGPVCLHKLQPVIQLRQRGGHVLSAPAQVPWPLRARSPAPWLAAPPAGPAPVPAGVTKPLSRLNARCDRHDWQKPHRLRATMNQLNLNDPNIQKTLREVFYPYATKKIDSMRRNSTRFVHYTSAENALNIIDGNQVWLRNTNLMNDFREVQHGQRCVLDAWNDDKVGGKLQKALNSLSAGLSERFIQRFVGYERTRSHETYMIAVSEHGNEQNREDLYGRLSMWRAYGGSTNVAFVFKNDPFLSESDALNAYTSPVLYADSEGFKPHFLEVAKNFEDHTDMLRLAGEDLTSYLLLSAFHFAVLSTKHPGFAEEREWRVIYTPNFYLTASRASRLESKIVCLGGIPQRIYSLKLENVPEHGFLGATLPELLVEVIIGPTQFPWPIYDALVEKLMNANVEDADKKVKVSNIPLRR